jgi:cardiolipin synthase
MVQMPLWLVVLLLVVIGVLILIIWSLKRRRRPNLAMTEKAKGGLQPTIEGLLQTTLVRGNRIELLQNGAYFDSLFRDVAAAKATITIETFLCKQGEVTRKLTDLLEKKAREGVTVRVLVDGSGGKNYGRDDVKRLRAAGCSMRKFHPFRLSNLGRLNQRTHRKLAVIDGRIGYVGGHCLVDSWLGNAEDKKHFRDISARAEGPVVRQFQSAFTDNWIEETGEVIAGEGFFPKLEEQGDSPAHVVFVSPIGGPSTLKLLHYVAIAGAKKSITIQNPYFLPDPDARKELIEAVKRGVSVRIMMPANAATDAKLVSHASHHHFGTLLRGGVRIWEYQQTLLHQKVFTIDGEWSSIGSTNFDDRSFEINDEVSLVVFDPKVAAQLEEAFEADRKLARERTFDEWPKRNAFHKLVDGAAFMLNEQL